jgi:hypothetical protein
VKSLRLVCDTAGVTCLGVRVAAAGQSLALSPSLSPSDGAGSGWPAAARRRHGAGVSSFYMPLQYHFIRHDASAAAVTVDVTIQP